MSSAVVSLAEEEVLALRSIVLDEDAQGALVFLKEKILAAIERVERSRLDVDGRRNL